MILIMYYHNSKLDTDDRIIFYYYTYIESNEKHILSVNI